jgi:hypothetical protein
MPIFRKSENTVSEVGSEMMLGDKLSQIGALGPPVFIHSLKRHPRGPEPVDGRAPKSGSRHYGASQHVCYSHPTVVNLL